MNSQDTQVNTTPNTHNEPLAQDVEVVYRLASGKHITVEVSPEIKEWLETTDRKIRSQSRQDRRRLGFVADVDALDMKHRLLQEDTADTVMRNETYRQLFQAMGMLSEVRRYRVYLYYFHGLKFKAIADLQNVTGNAVSVVRLPILGPDCLACRIFAHPPNPQFCRGVATAFFTIYEG